MPRNLSSNLSAKVFAKPEKVASALERDILVGRLQAGSRLQSEHELVNRFSVSRTTVRKGLELLAGRGLIRTKSGIGSFVTFDGNLIDNRLGWTRALASQQEKVDTRLVRLEIVKDRALAKRYDVSQHSFLGVERIRMLRHTGKVISCERSKVPLFDGLEDVPTRGLINGSLSETLRDAGLIAECGEEWADVIALTKPDAEMMGVSSGTIVLRTRRIVRDARKRMIEHVVSYLDPSHFALHLEF